MADNKDELVFDGMPGADAKTEEDVQPFQVDMNFEDEPKEENVEETETEETTEEEPVAEETTEEVTEEQVEEPVAEETESDSEETEPESVQGDDEQPVETVAEGSEEPEVEEVKEVEEPKAPMVPKSRLDEVLAKNKEMQKRLQDMEDKDTPETEKLPEYDFVTKEKEYQDLVLDGETEKAALLRNEIRAAEKEQIMSEMQGQMGQTVQQDRELHELNQKATEIMEVFPIFDEKSKSYDEKLTNEVMELRDAFIYQGYGAADSLAKATEVTLLSKKPELLQGGDTETTDPAPKLSKAVQEKKAKATVKKKVEASQAQPPEMKGESAKNKKVVDINTLSDDEFGALPEETLRRMRGDFD
tara:strand:- start:1015 stop:2088 length:1074 start_codon:yes stop_codon:yes gene_type:complete